MSLGALNATLAQAFGPGRVIAKMRLQDSPRALVALASDKGERVVVKWFKGERGPTIAERLRSEHDRIGPILAQGRFRLAAYRAVSAAHGLAVLTWAPGQRLDHALHAAPEHRAGAMALAGGWLAAYAAPACRAASFNLHARIRKRKESATDMSPEDAALLGEAMRAMRAIARDHAGIPLLQAATHGDFAPHNLHLVDEPPQGVLWGFDVQQTRVLPVSADAGRFLALISLRLGPIPGPRRNGLPVADLDAFLPAARLDDTPDLAFFIADQLIRTLIEKRGDASLLASARSLLRDWLEGRR